MLLSVAGSYLAMGVCFMTQSDAAFTQKDLPKMALIFSYAIAASLVGPIAWATLQYRQSGTRAVLFKALFLLGWSGLSAILLWIVTSKGSVLRFGAMPYCFLLVPIVPILTLWRLQSTLDRQR
jgi:hypothetical protein